MRTPSSWWLWLPPEVRLGKSWVEWWWGPAGEEKLKSLVLWGGGAAEL